MTSKYPNPLHDGTDATFDAYEVQEVGEYVDEQGRAFVEPIFSEAADPKKRFWTIYGHTMGEGEPLRSATISPTPPWPNTCTPAKAIH